MTPDGRPVEPRTLDEELLGAQAPAITTELTEAERIAGVARELETGFRALEGIGPGISVFGSARVGEDDPVYAATRACAQRLGEAGFTIITGGGPGVMEAANRGAVDVGAHSVGLNIALPHEQAANRYQDVELHFDHFFTRKVMFVRYAIGFVVFPGGFGTLDELFEALNLIVTEKVHHFPVVLAGAGHWRGLVDWLHGRVEAEGMLTAHEVGLLQLCDDPEEITRLCVLGARAQGRMNGSG